MATLATLVVKLVGDIADFQEKMDSAADRVQSAGRTIQSAGRTMTTHVTAPLLGAAVGATHFANQYNAGMANVASLGEEAQAHIAEWKPLVQDIAIEVGKSTGDMSDGLYNVVSAFGVADDTLDVLRINALAAAAGLSTTTEAIDLTSAVTKAYGDTSAEAVQHAADLALRTVQLGQTTFPELAASVGKVTPLTNALGVSQEELFAVMATATGVTGGAAEVSTQLRGVLQALMAPTRDMAVVMDSYGYSSGEAMLEALGLHGVMELLVADAEEGGYPLQALIGSIEGQTLAMAMAGSLSDEYVAKLGEMGDVAGTVDEAVAAQTEGVNANGFAMQQAGVRAQVMAERVGDALAPALTALLIAAEPVIGWLEEAATWFANADQEQQLLIAGVLAAVAAIGPLLMVIGTLTTGLGVVASVIGFLLSPIGLLIAAVVLLGYMIYTNWDMITGVLAAGKMAWDAIWGAIGRKLDEVWTTHIQPIFAAIEGFANWLSGISFNINIPIPDIPDWMKPGSPLPLHTAWQDFHQFLNRADFEPQFALPGGGDMGGVGPPAGGGGRDIYYISIEAEDETAVERAVGRALDRVGVNAANRRRGR
ncbi:MAG: phage tail tape measure protein [Chloroflexota bacterium]